jgi:hypothetical protein
LFEDLEKMNLELLLALPWNVMGDTYLRDFMPNAPMLQKFLEVKGWPLTWTVEMVGRA